MFYPEVDDGSVYILIGSMRCMRWGMQRLAVDSRLYNFWMENGDVISLQSVYLHSPKVPFIRIFDFVKPQRDPGAESANWPEDGRCTPL